MREVTEPAQFITSNNVSSVIAKSITEEQAQQCRSEEDSERGGGTFSPDSQIIYTQQGTPNKKGLDN